MLIRALQRTSAAVPPGTNFPILERFQNSDKAEFLRGWSARRQALVQEASRAFTTPTSASSGWPISPSTTVLRRAIGAFTESMESIEFRRLAICQQLRDSGGNS